MRRHLHSKHRAAPDFFRIVDDLGDHVSESAAVVLRRLQALLPLSSIISSNGGLQERRPAGSGHRFQRRKTRFSARDGTINIAALRTKQRVAKSSTYPWLK